MKLLPFAFLVVTSSCNSTVTKDKLSGIGSPKDTVETQTIRLLKILKDSSVQCIEVRAGDTIEQQTDYYFKTHFSDLNADGHSDIRVSVFSNLPNQCETYFFDPANNHYRYIENSELDFTTVDGSGLYYSYCRAGCADLNWESELGKVEDFRWKPLGLIAGKGCDAAGDKQEIRIYRFDTPGHPAKSLVETLPYKKNIPDFGAKWAFIKQYWGKNWQAFGD